MKADWFAGNVERIEDEIKHLNSIAIKWLELPQEERQKFFNNINMALSKIADAKEVLNNGSEKTTATKD